MKNMVVARVGAESQYDKHPVTPEVEKLLEQIANYRVVAIDPSSGYDKIFAQKQHVVYYDLNRSLRDISIIADLAYVNELVTYFCVNKTGSDFNKIQFV